MYAVDTRSGAILGSVQWPQGNQIFAVDWLPAAVTAGLPFGKRRNDTRERAVFYGFRFNDMSFATRRG